VFSPELEEDPPPFVLAVVGPTAVGKTSVAEEIAVRLGGQIVSADSMQVYRGMDVGTAKPSPGERRVPYHCIDVAEPGEAYSAARYQGCAREAFEAIGAAGDMPVLCGGTGLYIRAALDDWKFPSGDQVDNPVREQYEAFEREHGPEALHELLASRDATSAALVHPNNIRRVVRALEMLDGGTSYAEQHQGFSARESVYPCVMIGLAMDRAELYRRIDSRVDRMLERGLVDEVKRLLDAGLRDALTAAQAIGYKELVPVVEAGDALEPAVVDIKRASRRYAKRQLAWFRADPRVRWIDVTDLDAGAAADQAMAALDWANLSADVPQVAEGE
jgi:tRNA dimethylallyltransferase